MKKLIPIVAMALCLACTALPTTAQAWYYHHYCHCIHHYVYHHVYHYAYPQVFIEDAHVYVPRYYYYAPYSVVDHVLVHRSIEIGPEVHVVKPVTLFDALFFTTP